jgi:hypothetical protein
LVSAMKVIALCVSEALRVRQFPRKPMVLVSIVRVIDFIIQLSKFPGGPHYTA